MARRRFEHLFVESCVAVGHALPRYRFWLALHAAGYDPESLDRSEAIAFVDGGFEGFLRTHGHAIRPQRRRALRRRIAAFDPSRPTPEERFAALT